MDSPTGIIPEELIKPEMRTQVKAWLIAQPLPREVKRDLLFAWARTVRVKLGRFEVQMIMDSGVEHHE